MDKKKSKPKEVTLSSHVQLLLKLASACDDLAIITDANNSSQFDIDETKRVIETIRSLLTSASPRLDAIQDRLDKYIGERDQLLQKFFD